MKVRGVTILLFGVMIAIFAYMIVRIVFFIMDAQGGFDLLFSFLLLIAEVFGLVHSLGYFINVYKLSRTDDVTINQSVPELIKYPPIAVVVPSYKEPLSVIEETLICLYNLSYPNKRLFLLDDTCYDKLWDTSEKVLAYKNSVEALCKHIGIGLFRRKWRGAKAGIINDFLKFLDGEKMEDLDFHSNLLGKLDEKIKYLAIFDADMNPFPDFLNALTAHMEADSNAAFIQTPQYYTNFEANRVARAAGLQQLIFYEIICEGKALADAMFCCGSNVLIRKDALMSVGGFDESSVTEDFATSIKLHLNGWKTLYYNKVMAFGMGPSDLGGFFKQQFRWALGTLGLAFKLPGYFRKHARGLSFAKWWEYFLSSTHYFVGWFIFLMFMFPLLFLFFNLPSYFLDPKIYFSVFIPYVVLSFNAFIWSLMRHAKPSSMLCSMLLSSLTFPVFMKAAIYAILGIKGSFVVTPKTGGTFLSMREIWPQLLLLLLCVAGISWGLCRIYFEREPLIGLIVNVFWCAYNFAVLSSIFYFNNSDGDEA